MNSPDVRFLGWSVFALAFSLPLTVWIWAHEQRPAAPIIVQSAPPVSTMPVQRQVTPQITPQAAPKFQEQIHMTTPAALGQPPTNPKSVPFGFVRADAFPVTGGPSAMDLYGPHPENVGVAVEYAVNRDARVTMTALSPEDTVVAELGSLNVRAGKNYSTFWDAKETVEQDRGASRRVYFVRIVAQAEGKTMSVKKQVWLPHIP